MHLAGNWANYRAPSKKQRRLVDIGVETDDAAREQNFASWSGKTGMKENAGSGEIKLEV
jgi:hypothetical protein